MTALAPRNVEIIPAPNGNGQLPDLGLASDYVDQLVAGADDETLHEFRNQAEAHRLYQVRVKNRANANHFARFQLLAEAGLGSLSIIENPQIGRSVTPALNAWRALAMAYERGVLMEICDELEREGLSLSTARVSRLLRKRGWTRVDRRALSGLIEAKCKQEGISKPKLADKIGVARHCLYVCGSADAMLWPVAVRFARLVGIDPTSLQPHPPSRRGPRKGPPLWLVRERVRKGSQWDRAYGYFRQCLDQFRELAPNNDPRWDKAYEHLYEIERIIGDQMRLGS